MWSTPAATISRRARAAPRAGIAPGSRASAAQVVPTTAELAAAAAIPTAEAAPRTSTMSHGRTGAERLAGRARVTPLVIPVRECSESYGRTQTGRERACLAHRVKGGRSQPNAKRHGTGVRSRPRVTLPDVLHHP